MTSSSTVLFHQKVEGRIFATPSSPVGGNPLTIYVVDRSVHSQIAEVHSTLAKTCLWESVIIHDINHDMPEIFFYVPSGQSIAYCAHAAMGASAYMARWKSIDRGIIQFHCGNGDSIESAMVDSNIVTLYIKNNLEEQNVDTIVIEKLLSLVGLSITDVVASRDTIDFPSMLNSSVNNRSKTLVMVPSVEKLHSARNPSDSNLFRDLCDEIQSTGLYLYSRTEPAAQSYECRQFPRSSGYPEDPATGIAASALASSLDKRGWGTAFEFFQGTAMGRRSRITVTISSSTSNELGSIECSGLVLFDSVVES